PYLMFTVKSRPTSKGSAELLTMETNAQMLPYSPGTPINPDLQAWIRNANLDPDWLRVGTDIVGGANPPTFNGAFTLNGQQVPEPSTLCLALFGLGGWRSSKRYSRPPDLRLSQEDRPTLGMGISS